ncbi:MAG: hypothetical protein ACRC1M_08565 [Methanobacteriaceae archaeon]
MNAKKLNLRKNTENLKKDILENDELFIMNAKLYFKKILPILKEIENITWAEDFFMGSVNVKIRRL